MRSIINLYIVGAMTLILLSFVALILDESGRSILSIWGIGWNISWSKIQEVPFILMIFAAGLYALAVAFCWACYQEARTNRILADLINDEPTVPIRALQISDLVKIRGELKAEETSLISPLQQKPCLYYSTEVTKVPTESKHASHRRLFFDEKRTEGVLDDGSGMIALATDYFPGNAELACRLLNHPDKKLIKRINQISGYDFSSTEFIDAALEISESTLGTGSSYLAIGRVCEAPDGQIILKSVPKSDWRTPELTFLTRKSDVQAQEWLEMEFRRANVLSKTLMATLLSVLVGPLPLFVSLLIFGISFFLITTTVPEPVDLKIPS